MSRPSYLVTPQIQRLPQLLTEVMEGAIRIPRFQRPFVWQDQQRLELMESIYRGMPIGTIMVWRTRKYIELATYDRLGPFGLSGDDLALQHGRTVQFLLDGHQRLSTLYGALAPGLASLNEKSLTRDSASDAGDWPIYFDLESMEFALNPGGAVPTNWVPLTILLDPYELHRFQSGLIDAGAPRALVNRAENLASTFKDYSIPVVPIVADDMELVTTSFQRINSAGTQMSEVHMVSALSWTSGFDLNQRIEEMQEELAGVGWQELDGRMILNVIKASMGLDVYKASPVQITEKLNTRPEVLDEALANIVRAAEFLRKECGILGPKTLPYSFQIVVLADFMRLSGSGSSEEVNNALAQWLWWTTYTEYFRGMTPTTLNRALTLVRSLVGGVQELVFEEAPPIAPPSRFDYRAARSRAWSLRLAELGPLGLGQERYQARELLALHGNEATFHLVPRFAGFTTAPENRIIAPPRDGLTLATELRENPVCVDDCVLESHAIGKGVALALLARDFKQALVLRRQELCSREQRFVESLGLDYVVGPPES